MSSLRVAEAERSGPDLLPKQLDAAWDAFADSVPEDVATEVMAAVRDPAPLAEALAQAGPVTLLHGDLRDDNLGLTERPDRAAGLGPRHRRDAHGGVRLVPLPQRVADRRDHDEIEQDYREAEGDRLDPREAELGMISGLVQYGWIFGHSLRIHPDPAERAWAEEELGWWVPRVRRALEASR